MSEFVAYSGHAFVPSHVLVRHLADETVLLNLETEKYFGLDATGTLMWQLATQSPTLEAAYAHLSDQFDVQPEILRSHFTGLLRQLVEHGLLTLLPRNEVTSRDVESLPAI
ncbi:MAG TPA: PqqD family protein [Candidatus Eremiobacteraceae bacterium]|nr:PqqD family protein [Candidatus Eremiobacteraceae bacterium]